MSAGTIPEATALRIERELVRRHHLFVTAKTGAVWDTVSATFDLVRALGVKNLPSGRDFVTKFGTSLGPLVILPDAPLSPTERVCLLAHEAEHARQFFAAPGEMPVRYLSIPEARGSHYEVPTAKHRTQTMRAVDGRPGYLRLPRWFRRGLRATQHVAVSARAAWSIARALLVAAVLTGCPGWVRPECATPGRYECRANQPHYCGTSKQLTPIGDVPCGAGETCSLNAEGVAHCAPATDGGVQ